jgi:hypothetical protein
MNAPSSASSAASVGSVDNGGSAWQSVGNTVGDGNTQWKNTFEGPTNMFGNSIRNIGLTQPSSVADTNIAKGPFQSGGRRRKHRKSRSRKGGFFGSGALETAAVPFGLLAAQQYYASRTRKHGRR